LKDTCARLEVLAAQECGEGQRFWGWWLALLDDFLLAGLSAASILRLLLLLLLGP
jgi:hypothetical protein